MASASKSRTPVNATGPAGMVTSAFARPGACSAIAAACAASIFVCSPLYASGSHAIPKVIAKNLLFASAQTGSGEVPMPVTDHNVIVWRAWPVPTSRSISLAARALPPGRRSSDLSALASSDSRNQAVPAIGPPCET